MSEQPFNELTPGQVERLALLAEELAEAVQVVGKILRHGLHSCHPNDLTHTDNLALLEIEMGHVHYAESLLTTEGYSTEAVAASFRDKRIKVIKYLHHQP